MKATQASEARYGAPGVSGAAPLATREPVDIGLLGRAGRALLSWVKTAAVTLGTIYVIGWFVVSLGVWGLNRVYPPTARFDDVMLREMAARPMRSYALPPDTRITLAEAGRAYAALLEDPRGGNGIVVKTDVQPAERPWKGLEMDPTLFRTARPSSYAGPNASVITASAAGFNSRERAVLKMIATAPIWRDWDIVVRAPKLDAIGARFEIPFGSQAHVQLMPLVRFGATKELAYAAISRAAWHLSEGRRDSAEIVLRAIVSYGFSVSENGGFAIDQLIGNVVVGIGRDALVRFYALTNDPRGPAIDAEYKRALQRPVPAALHVSVKDYKLRRLATIGAVESHDLSRGIRLEMLWQVALNSCGSGRELTFGMNSDTRAVFDRARRDWARYPSERAMIDLVQHSLEAPLADALESPGPQALAAVDLVGRIYFNPRLGMCALSGLNRGNF